MNYSSSLSPFIKGPFDLIENSYSHQELNKLAPLRSSEYLKTASIFHAVEMELQNVIDDIGFVYKSIHHDIDIELNQSNTIELNLKKTLKKVNQIYKSTTKVRSNIRNTQLDDITSFDHDVAKKSNAVERSLSDLVNTVKDVTADIIDINMRLPQKYQPLNIDIINKTHYPLLFEKLQNAQKDIAKVAISLENGELNKTSNSNSNTIQTGFKLGESTSKLKLNKHIDREINFEQTSSSNISENNAINAEESESHNAVDFTQNLEIDHKVESQILSPLKASKPSTFLSLQTVENQSFKLNGTMLSVLHTSLQSKSFN